MDKEIKKTTDKTSAQPKTKANVDSTKKKIPAKSTSKVNKKTESDTVKVDIPTGLNSDTKTKAQTEKQTVQKAIANPKSKNSVGVKKKTISKKASQTLQSKLDIVKENTNKSIISNNTIEKPLMESPVEKRKYTPRKKTEKRMTEEIADVMRKDSGELVKEQKEKRKKGKVFYLIFSIVFYVSAYFYINTVLYNNQDHLQSALFAFAALFVVFVLLQFNIHMIIVNFFRLPFQYLLSESRLEIKHKADLTDKQKHSKIPFARYKAIFTMTLYAVISLLLVGSQIYSGVADGDEIIVIIMQSSITLFVFLIIVCSWQYLFNILPRVLDKSIDAKNGFILTLSAAVMVIYVVFIIFDIVYLAELMIFVLIVGFVALLGVNLNMIVGEINIFQNLKTKHSKTISRVVFLIFFSFHMYVILYASVVAYSIYNWKPEAYNFAYPEYETIVVEPIFDIGGNRVENVYDNVGNLISVVYDISGSEIDNFYDVDGKLKTPVYTIDGLEISRFYDISGSLVFEVYDSIGNPLSDFQYVDGTLVGTYEELKMHDYGDFLYYTVVTVSTLGYGDISPSTDYNIAQAWGGFLSIYGFTFFALSISFVSNIAMEGSTKDREDDNDD